MMDYKYFYVRPKLQNETYRNLFLENNIVAVGWSDYIFKDFDDIEELIPQIAHLKSISNNSQASRYKNQIRRFKNLNETDRVIVPIGSHIYLSEVEKEEIYNKNAYYLDQSNQRRVKYLKSGKLLVKIPRNSLSEGLQRRIRVRGMTISYLWEFKNELDSLFLNAQNGINSWKNRVYEASELIVEQFKNDLLRNIQGGNTNLKAGGIGLELLVKELLEINGYSTKILPKSKFSHEGDADIVAKRIERFNESHLLVQVKHHYGVSNTKSAKQLLKIIEIDNEEFENFQLVVVLSSTPANELIELCDEENIILIDGKELCDWIYEEKDTLNEKTKISLGIIEVPRLMQK